MPCLKPGFEEKWQRRLDDTDHGKCLKRAGEKGPPQTFYSADRTGADCAEKTPSRTNALLREVISSDDIKLGGHLFKDGCGFDVRLEEGCSLKSQRPNCWGEYGVLPD